MDDGYLPVVIANLEARVSFAEANARLWQAQHERRRAANIRLEAKVNGLIEEIGYVITARRFDRETFSGDTEFADWALSRLRHAHASAVAKPAIATYAEPDAAGRGRNIGEGGGL